MRAAVIYNPSAGRGRAGVIASAVERGLVKRGLEAELFATQRPTDAMDIAGRLVSQVDVIVAVGGDGTINEVVNGMTRRRRQRPNAQPRAKLGIVPAGTVNVLALDLGLPFQVERACNVIAGGRTVFIDVGGVNKRGFVLMMGAGVDALTVANIDPRTKKRFRELAFLGTGLKVGLATPPPAFVVRTGGREYTATFFVASNSRYYAGHLGLTPEADLTDGVLDLLVFTGTTRSSLATFWLEVPSRLHLRNSNVIYLRGEQAELIPLEEKETIWFQTDGELAGKLPATVEIDAHALEVLVP